VIEQPQPFTVEDVEAAWFAYGIDQCLEPGQTPEMNIRQRWPLGDRALFEGHSPMWPRLFAEYKRGSEILLRAEVVSRRVLGEVLPQDYEQLGQVDSPIWLDDPKQHQLVRRGRELEKGPRLYHLRALRLRRSLSE
jgi:hypothetical protein